ncbi:MAG TPA: hypothetical protein VFJ58_13325 [Armatimonadota bacterium]|nr:hypothetical protein [Armatimonadota bacterium]
MVQEPYPTQRPGFSTIAEIGKERMHRVIARMDPAHGGDLGFRVMKIPL